MHNSNIYLQLDITSAEYKNCNIVSFHNKGYKLFKKLIAKEGECQIIKNKDMGIAGNLVQYEAWYVDFLKTNYETIKKAEVDDIQLWIDLYMTKSPHGYEVFNKEQLSALGKMNVSIPITIHIMSKKEILKFAKENKIFYNNIDDLF